MVSKSYPYFDPTGVKDMDEDEWENYFGVGRIAEDGVVPGYLSNMRLSHVSGFTVAVAPGAAYIDGHRYETDPTGEQVSIAPPSASPRIDAVVLRSDSTTGGVGGGATLAVLTGTPAGSPIAPTPANTATRKELLLGTVEIGVGVFALTNNVIRNTPSWSRVGVGRNLPLENSIGNPNFYFRRRGLSNNAVVGLHKYFDRWNTLIQGANAVLLDVEASDVPAGIYSAGRFTTNVGLLKYGSLQILGSEETFKFRGRFASYCFDYKSPSYGISTIRAQLLGWVGTADTGITNPVGAWGANAGGISSWAANWVPLGAQQILYPSNIWQTIFADGIEISGVNNLALFTWNDDMTTTPGEVLLLTNVNLVPYQFCNITKRRTHLEELDVINRYLWTSYPIGSNPGTVTNTNRFMQYIDGLPSAVHTVISNARYGGVMRANPTVSVYSPATGAIGKVSMGGNVDANATVSEVGPEQCRVQGTDPGAVAAAQLSFHLVADADL